MIRAASPSVKRARPTSDGFGRFSCSSVEEPPTSPEGSSRLSWVHAASLTVCVTYQSLITESARGKETQTVRSGMIIRGARLRARLSQADLGERVGRDRAQIA